MLKQEGIHKKKIKKNKEKKYYLYIFDKRKNICKLIFAFSVVALKKQYRNIYIYIYICHIYMYIYSISSN